MKSYHSTTVEKAAIASEVRDIAGSSGRGPPRPGFPKIVAALPTATELTGCLLVHAVSGKIEGTPEMPPYLNRPRRAALPRLRA